MLFILFVLFALFPIMSIRKAFKQYELNGKGHQRAIGIISFALVVAAAYGGAWLTGVAISFAAQYIEIFRELLRLLNDPTIGKILSILVAAPTTILAVVVIPKWTFHLAAHGKLKWDNNQPVETPDHARTERPQKNREQEEYQKEQPSRSEKPRPPSRPAKERPSQNTTRTRTIVLAVVCVLIGGVVGIAAISLLNYDQPLGQTEIQPLAELEIMKPLPTVPIKPTYTPMPPRPTATRLPLPTPTTPVSLRNVYVAAFGSCAGQYHGEEEAGRQAAAIETLDGGLRSLEELRAIIDENCAGTIDAATARIEPMQTREPAPTLTPIPTATPWASPTATPSPPGRVNYNRPTPTPAPLVTYRPTATPTPSEPSIIIAPTRAYAGSQISKFQNGKWLHDQNPSLAQRMEKIGWVADGLNPLEEETVKYLLYIAVRKREAALSKIIEMPFLRTVEPADLSAMKSLWRILHDNPSQFDRVMNHPTLQAGITDEWTTVITTLASAANNNPRLIHTLLDPQTVSVESRKINLPLSGSIVLAIVRTEPGPNRSMDLLQHAVTQAEQQMGIALPTQHVVLLFADASKPGYAGTNYESHIVINKGYDVDDGSQLANHLLATIAHEVAHYYWRSNSDWIDEGMATLLEANAEYARTGKQIATTYQPCSAFDNIAQLDRAKPSIGTPNFICNYALGERLFIELLDALGSRAFSNAAKSLYLESTVEDSNPTAGTEVGIDEMRRLFGKNAGGATVIWRWYDGTEPYDISRIDQSPPTWKLPTIRGEITKAALVLQQNGTETTRFSMRTHSGHAYLLLKYKHSVGGGPYERPVTLVQYYQDGHPTGIRTVTVKADEQYNGGSWTTHYQVGPQSTWKPGQYWAMIYDGTEKAAEVSWVVDP